MKLKDEITYSRYHIMFLRARGLSTRPQIHFQEEVKKFQELCAVLVQQRDDLVRTLDKAEAHIKFLENEIRARGTT